MYEHYYYFPCPLCEQDVDVSQTDSYRCLLLDRENFAMFNGKPAHKQMDRLTIGDHDATCRMDYSGEPYMNRAWVLHMRCISFVNHLRPAQLYQLLDLVEPTILLRSNRPKTQHGAFYAQPGTICDENDDPAVMSKRRLVEMAGSLPAEIWNLILEYDIGRLLFITRTTSQLTGPDIQSEFARTPNPRFTARILDLTSSIIQIHLIDIGGRLYIRNLSNQNQNQSPVDNSGAHDINVRWVSLCGSKYLAVKSDGVGIVDIAFEEEQQDTSQPKWVLSHIRDANFRSLRIIQDSLKCRTIIPTNRGPEPYFHKPPFPPVNCWVNSSISFGSRLAELKDPYIYFTRTVYIPFANMKQISFFYIPVGTGIKDTYVNDPKQQQHEKYSVTFTDPPTEFKFILCSHSRARMYYLFIRFQVDDQWVPSRSPNAKFERERSWLKNALGIWLGSLFIFEPVAIGAVVSQPTDV